MSHKMASSSSYFSDHHYGGTSETSSSSTPHVIKPTIVTSSKQRSSSMNSITSNHSVMNASGLSTTSTSHPVVNTTTTNTVRSLSIISLESPRNSIVSIDDNLIRPTRNNSTTSLASLNIQQPTAFLNNPTTLSQIHHHASTSIHESPKVRGLLNTSAILSDDDSEFEISTPIGPAAIAARSILKPVFKLKKNSEQLVNLKKDFKFKYDDFTHSNRVPTTPSSPSTNTNAGYQSASPTSSVTLTNLNTALRNLQDVTPSPLSLEKISNESLTAKKKKSSSLIQHSILKKKSIYSKDLQFELTNCNPNSNVSTTLKSIETKFVNSKSSNNATSEEIISDEPIMKTLKEQNKLIHKLNRKWNKGGVHFDKEKDKQTKTTQTTTPPIVEVGSSSSTGRKRSRDSFDTDDDNNYDDYDDYDD